MGALETLRAPIENGAPAPKVPGQKNTAGMAGAPFRPLGPNPDFDTRTERGRPPRCRSGILRRICRRRELRSSCRHARERNRRNGTQLTPLASPFTNRTGGARRTHTLHATHLQLTQHCLRSLPIPPGSRGSRGVETQAAGATKFEVNALTRRGMTREFVLFLFSLICARRSSRRTCFGACQMAGMPRHSATVAGMHRCRSNMRDLVRTGLTVTRLLCRRFRDWSIRGLHETGATCRATAWGG